MHILLLSGENLKLARLEAESLLDLGITRIDANLLYCNVSSKSICKLPRLAYTQRAFDVLYTTEMCDIEKSLQEYSWSRLYTKSFCLRIEHSSCSHSDQRYEEAHLAGHIWKSLKAHSKKVVRADLRNPELLIQVFIGKKTCYVTREVYDNKISRIGYEDRRAHMRPILSPTAMHPKMARALVNILAKKSVIDPFCGTGGIITEAALMGVRSRGYDIDQQSLDNARVNLDYLGIRKDMYSLARKDSTKLRAIQDIITDLPYGKSSKKTDEIPMLYSRFIQRIRGDAVIVMPDFVDYKAILRDNLSHDKGLYVYDVIDQYVHKSLTRKIIIIRKKKDNMEKI